MLDRMTMDAIGATLRRLHEATPKGGIPADHWRSLLDMERMTNGGASPRRNHEGRDTTLPGPKKSR